MKLHRFDEQFALFIDLGLSMCRASGGSALFLMLSGPTEWDQLKRKADGMKVVVAADDPEDLVGAEEAGLLALPLDLSEAPVIERLTQALLRGVAREILTPGDGVVVMYSGFEADALDSISFIRLDEHLGRLTARDLRQLETSVPLETLKTVVDLAVDRPRGTGRESSRDDVRGGRHPPGSQPLPARGLRSGEGLSPERAGLA
jgi:diadenylate cyclase